MKRLVCTIVLLLMIVGGIARRYWHAYDTVKGQVEAEQDYVERVKREAGP